MSLPGTLQSWVDEHQRAIQVTLANGLILPAVALVYTVVDSLGFLARPTEQVNTGADYEAWVMTYLLDGYDGRAGTAAKVARDLYGARCAVLHRMTAEANLTVGPDPARRAREVYYQRSTGEGRIPVESANTPEPALFVDPDRLAGSLVAAVGRFAATVDADVGLRERVERRSTHYFHVTHALGAETL